MHPANKTKTIILLSAAIVIIFIVAGIRIQQSLRSSVAEPSIVVKTGILENNEPAAKYDQTEVLPLPAVSPPNPVVSPPKSQITARAYLVGNAKTGQAYFSSNPKKVMPVASMSKLITTLAATDTLPPTSTITITAAETNVPPDGSNLYAGETFTLKEILYPLLLASSNIAAEAIASSSDRMKFLELMSGYAQEIGMPTSYFADPTGLDPRNQASANDMLALARYLYVYRPNVLALSRVVHIDMATTSDHGSHSIDNIHPFVRDPRFLGGKTGRTPEAGETMLTILLIDDQPIVFVVMGSEYGRRGADTDLLIKKFENMAH